MVFLVFLEVNVEQTGFWKNNLQVLFRVEDVEEDLFYKADCQKHLADASSYIEAIDFRISHLH